MKNVIGLILLLIATGTHAMSPEEKEHLTELAESGDSEAMYSLFLDVAERGSIKPPPSREEYEQATQWLLKAGELNNWRAAYVLQLCYAKGCWGLSPNKEKAEYYKDVVAQFGPNK